MNCERRSKRTSNIKKHLTNIAEAIQNQGSACVTTSDVLGVVYRAGFDFVSDCGPVWAPVDMVLVYTTDGYTIAVVSLDRAQPQVEETDLVAGGFVVAEWLPEYYVSTNG